MSSILREFGGGASEQPRRQGTGSKTGNHKGWGPPSSVPKTSCPQPVHSPAELRLVTICLYRCGDAVSRLILPGVIHRG